MKIKALVTLVSAMMFFGALCAPTFLVPVAEAKCIYCNSDNIGDCSAAPYNDKSNPKRKHKHHPEGKKCVWCKLENNPQSCSHSPDGKHQEK